MYMGRLNGALAVFIGVFSTWPLLYLYESSRRGSCCIDMSRLDGAQELNYSESKTKLKF